MKEHITGGKDDGHSGVRETLLVPLFSSFIRPVAFHVRRRCSL